MRLLLLLVVVLLYVPLINYKPFLRGLKTTTYLIRILLYAFSKTIGSAVSFLLLLTSMFQLWNYFIPWVSRNSWTELLSILSQAALIVKLYLLYVFSHLPFIKQIFVILKYICLHSIFMFTNTLKLIKPEFLFRQNSTFKRKAISRTRYITGYRFINIIEPQHMFCCVLILSSAAVNL